MGLFRQKRFVRLLLAVLALAGLAWLATLDYDRKISTNVLDLIPNDERAPELALTRELASEEQSRVALFALDLRGDPVRREAASAAFVRTLSHTSAFDEVVALHDTGARDALGKQVFKQRFDLLLPGWLENHWKEYAAGDRREAWPDWLAERVAVQLQDYLGTPEALAFQEILPSDPLLLLPKLIESVQGIDNPVPASGDAPILIWARTKDSPWKEEGQGPVFAAVREAEAAAQVEAPGGKVRWVSIGRIAAASRDRIEHELSGLNLLSLAAVMGIAALCLRRVDKALHLAPVMLGGLLGAWVATTLLFDRVHILVFVVGSLLGGVAVDYGFYLYLQPPAFPEESYGAKVGRLIKPLLASALTTVIGFSLLLFSELPLIRQLGVFVSAGLLSALATALLWFAQVGTPFMQTRDFARIRVTGNHPLVRRIALGFLLLGTLVALGGPWFLHWRDDIRELEIPTPALQAEATEVRALFGENSQRTLFITPGKRRGDRPCGAGPFRSLARTGISRSNPRVARQRPSHTLGLAGGTRAPWRFGDVRTSLARRPGTAWV